jgi:hypothetical protein
MALQSALLSVPVGVRFTALTKEGVVFLWGCPDEHWYKT